MSTAQYEYLRDEISLLHEFFKICKEYGSNETRNNAIIRHKRSIRSCYKTMHDSLEKSISEEWRTLSSRDGESWTNYIIFEDDGMSDEEIQQTVENMRMRTGYAFDCTGRPFTVSLHWSRQPSGIVVVHRMALDI